MKLSVVSKPISSPGRADKFPPPLMRFLRSNVGSRSRGRSRSSPMFIRKQKTASAAAGGETTQEPSSPKVTCMGQVQVRRSNSKQPGRPGKNPPKRRRRWIRDALLCHRFRRKRKQSPRPWDVSLTRAWRRWASCCQLGCGGQPGRTEDLGKAGESNWGRNNEIGTGLERKREEEEEEDDEGFAVPNVYGAVSSSPCSPPKNALMLTRCRSAPYRSSSLVSRFWSSPLKDAADEAGQAPKSPQDGGTTATAASSDDGDTDEAAEQPKKNSNVSSRGSDPEARVHPEEEESERFLILKETEGAVAKLGKIGELKLKEEGVVVVPLRLTRCKSEPARTAAQKVGFH